MAKISPRFGLTGRRLSLDGESPQATNQYQRSQSCHACSLHAVNLILHTNKLLFCLLLIVYSTSGKEWEQYRESMELVLHSPMKLRHRQTPFRNKTALNLILCPLYAQSGCPEGAILHKGMSKRHQYNSPPNCLGDFQFRTNTNAFLHRPAISLAGKSGAKVRHFLHTDAKKDKVQCE